PLAWSRSMQAPTAPPARRIALLGQRDALVRALLEVAHRRRLQPLDVLVVVPVGAGAPSAISGVGTIRGVCDTLGFGCVGGETDEAVLAELSAFGPELIVSIPGATCHRMVYDFDAGRILDQEAVPIAPGETALSLSVKIAAAAELCFRRVFGTFLDTGGLPEGRLWDVQEFPYHFRKLPRGGVIDPEWPDDKVERFVRAMYFPPHAPATLVRPDGLEYPVRTMEEYAAAREGRAVRGTSTSSGAAPARPAPACDPHQASCAPGGTRPRARGPWLPSGGGAVGLLAAALVLLAALVSVPRGAGSERQAGSAGSSAVGRPPPAPAARHTLEAHPRARCLDGSPAAFYLAPATSAEGRGRWVVYLQGGGWCAESAELAGLPGYSHADDVGHPDLCSRRAKGYLGSSRFDWASRSLEGKGFLSGDPTENPSMHSWNRVVIRNCDGTLFLSSLDEPMQLPGGGALYFRGRDNAFAVVDALLERHGMDSASEVVISGCSAGGVAAVLLADALRRRVEERARAGRPFVAVLSDSGVFPGPGPVGSSAAPEGLLRFPQFQWLFERTNLSGSLPPPCTSEEAPWGCLHVLGALPHVATPVFLLQSLADSWQLSEPAGPAQAAFAAGLRQQFALALRWPHAAAVDSCFHHGGAWGRIGWGGVTNRDAFWRWYTTGRERWVANSSSSAGPGEYAAEGWPLVHAANAPAPDCYEGQERHQEWHRSLARLPARPDG
ncbi:unnamed protein product, partial [Prorocentrum cordatum]